MDSGLIPVKRSSGVVNAARGTVAVRTGGSGGGGDGATLGPNARRWSKRRRVRRGVAVALGSGRGSQRLI
ncbi:hypothetical protein ROHU_003354 [Labeo rohita]|uniref:Uncharacterized protein n=1 Tax=Labeo rohita TaxID=84645 RepID=A0A498NVS2_LABRO|nr:hypothetical protein ROHU_003354 [Labeo rohita]